MNEFLDERDLQKFAKTRKRIQLKKMQEIKIILGIRTTPCVIQIHKINKTICNLTHKIIMNARN